MIASTKTTFKSEKIGVTSPPFGRATLADHASEARQDGQQSPIYLSSPPGHDAGAADAAPSNGPVIDLRSLAASLEFVIAEAILPDLRAADKESALRTLVYRLADAGALPVAERDEVFAAVLRRESVSPTAIGSGVAIPHAKHRGLQRVVAAVAYCPDGINFEGRYGTAVRLIVLLVSPEDNPTAYLHALSALSQLLLEATRSSEHSAVATSP